MADVRNNYSFIRVAPCTNANRGDGSLGKALGHLDKHLESADISREELSHLNKSFIDNPKSFRDCIKLGNEFLKKHNDAVDEYNKAHGLSGKKAHRHMKQGTYQFFEGVMTFSPDMEKDINIDEWSKKSFEFLKQEYEAKGCEILRCDLHCDESSIHMQFIIACFDKEAQSCSYRNLIGGKASLSQLQDRYGDAMAEFGLVRGFSRYKENYALKEMAAEFYHTTVDKLTKPQWLTWCEMHKVEPKKAKRHKEISKWKAEQSAKETAELEAKFKAKHDELEAKYQAQFNKYKGELATMKTKIKTANDEWKKNYLNAKQCKESAEKYSKQTDEQKALFEKRKPQLEAQKEYIDTLIAKSNIAELLLNCQDIDDIYDTLYDIYYSENDNLTVDEKNSIADALNQFYEAKNAMREFALSFVDKALWVDQKKLDALEKLVTQEDIANDEIAQNTPSRDDEAR